MSFMHDLIQHIIRRGHRSFDPDNPPDYVKRRADEEKRFSSLPKDLKVTLIQEEGICGEKITKNGNDDRNIILYIHGGGFVGGSARSRRDVTFYLARHSGYHVIAINYPLAPESHFPLPVRTCLEAYSHLVKEYGAEHIAIMGESAGGNLVLATLLMAENEGVELPSSITLYSPATVLGKQMPSYLKNGKRDAILDENIHIEISHAYFSSEADSENIYASPLYGDFHGFPPVLLYASDSEVLMDDSILLDAKMKEQGVDITFHLAHNMMHAYPVMPYYREAKQALKETITFIRNHFPSAK